MVAWLIQQDGSMRLCHGVLQVTDLYLCQGEVTKWDGIHLRHLKYSQEATVQQATDIFVKSLEATSSDSWPLRYGYPLLMNSMEILPQLLSAWEHTPAPFSVTNMIPSKWYNSQPSGGLNGTTGLQVSEHIFQITKSLLSRITILINSNKYNFLCS